MVYIDTKRVVYKEPGGGPEPLPDVKTNRQHESGEFVSQPWTLGGS